MAPGPGPPLVSGGPRARSCDRCDRGFGRGRDGSCGACGERCEACDDGLEVAEVTHGPCGAGWAPVRTAHESRQRSKRGAHQFGDADPPGPPTSLETPRVRRSGQLGPGLRATPRHSKLVPQKASAWSRPGRHGATCFPIVGTPLGRARPGPSSFVGPLLRSGPSVHGGGGAARPAGADARVRQRAARRLPAPVAARLPGRARRLQYGSGVPRARACIVLPGWKSQWRAMRKQ